MLLLCWLPPGWLKNQKLGFDPLESRRGGWVGRRGPEKKAKLVQLHVRIFPLPFVRGRLKFSISFSVLVVLHLFTNFQLKKDIWQRWTKHDLTYYIIWIQLKLKNIKMFHFPKSTNLEILVLVRNRMSQYFQYVIVNAAPAVSSLLWVIWYISKHACLTWPFIKEVTQKG